jgi:subtilisin family serine protease
MLDFGDEVLHNTAVRGKTTEAAMARRKHVPRSAPICLEPLEARLCLSASADAARTWLIEWGGSSVEAHRDAWIVKSVADKPGISAGKPGITAGFHGSLGGPNWSARDIGEGFYSLSTPGATVQDVTAWAAATTGVASIEPDFVLASRAIPNDTSFGQLWGLHNTGQSGGTVDADIDAPAAWDITTGSRSVVVAVIDTGIDTSHPDLAANIWRNPRETPGNGIDDDGNGFIDDINGWDFANGDSNPFDDNGHGTHVAGTIGAVGDNGRGVAGVAWQVSIMGLKFLSGSGSGSTSGAIAAINYATQMRRDFGINIVATNNSWGGGGSSTSLRDAIQAGGNAGILFVAAAGNESNDNDASPSYPASYTSSSIISVAATNRFNQMSDFSNYGATSVDLAAPGESIYSTTPGNSYASYSGTSMATPHVTGVVALLAAAAPQATASQIRSAILASTTPVAALAGKVATGGLLNAAAALQELVGSADLRANIRDVSPDPRTDAVASIVIEFNRQVTGFDQGDLRLTRNGIPVPLDAASLDATPGNASLWTLSGLAGLTSEVGSYTLSLPAAGSGIVDGGSSPLSANASESWQVIPPPPPAPGEPNDSIASAVSVTLVGGRATVTGYVGNGVHDGADVDLLALTLVAGATLTVDLDARTLPQASSLDSYVRLFNASGVELAFNDDFDGSLDSRLSHTVAAGGTYYVGVSSYGNSSYDPLVAGSGTPGFTEGEYSVAITAELPPLVADIVDVTPDPRLSGVEAIQFEFNRPARNVGLEDLVLTRSGVVVPLTTATLAPINDVVWSLGNLWDLTSAPGGYTLVLRAGSSGIVDDNGMPLSANASDSFTVSPPVIVTDAGDTIAKAVRIDATAAIRSSVRLPGQVGDGSKGAKDVDFYRISLARGQRLVIDLDAASLPVKSPLDGYLRLFNSSGRQVASNDDFNGSADSLISFTARTAGTYYVGVSGFGNSSYDPTRAGSGRTGSTGGYEIAFSIQAASQIGSTVSVMGFADAAPSRRSLSLEAAFAAMADWGRPPLRRPGFPR